MHGKKGGHSNESKGERDDTHFPLNSWAQEPSSVALLHMTAFIPRTLWRIFWDLQEQNRALIVFIWQLLKQNLPKNLCSMWLRVFASWAALSPVPEEHTAMATAQSWPEPPAGSAPSSPLPKPEAALVKYPRTPLFHTRPPHGWLWLEAR